MKDKFNKKKKYDVSEIYMATECMKSTSEHGGFAYSYSIGGGPTTPLIKIGDKLCSDSFGYSKGQILSTRSREVSSIELYQIEKYVQMMEEDPRYEGKPYAFLADVQRFDKFLEQFGIDVGNLEKITLDKASMVMLEYYNNGRSKLIQKYLGIDGIFVMTEETEKRKIQEVLVAIQEGKFKVSPKFFGLKQKNIFRRFIDSHRKRKLLTDGTKRDDFLDELPKAEILKYRVERDRKWVKT